MKLIKSHIHYNGKDYPVILLSGSNSDYSKHSNIPLWEGQTFAGWELIADMEKYNPQMYLGKTKESEIDDKIYCYMDTPLIVTFHEDSIGYNTMKMKIGRILCKDID